MAQFLNPLQRKKVLQKLGTGAANVMRKIAAKPKPKPKSKTLRKITHAMLGVNRQLSERQKKRMTPAQIKADRRRRMRIKIMDMSPAEKKAEIARLQAKKKAKSKITKKKVQAVAKKS